MVELEDVNRSFHCPNEAGKMYSRFTSRELRVKGGLGAPEIQAETRHGKFSPKPYARNSGRNPIREIQAETLYAKFRPKPYTRTLGRNPNFAKTPSSSHHLQKTRIDGLQKSR